MRREFCGQRRVGRRRRSFTLVSGGEGLLALLCFATLSCVCVCVLACVRSTAPHPWLSGGREGGRAAAVATLMPRLRSGEQKDIGARPRPTKPVGAGQWSLRIAQQQFVFVVDACSSEVHNIFLGRTQQDWWHHLHPAAVGPSAIQYQETKAHMVQSPKVIGCCCC